MIMVYLMQTTEDNVYFLTGNNKAETLPMAAMLFSEKLFCGLTLLLRKILIPNNPIFTRCHALGAIVCSGVIIYI